jgi:hypothetical protein
MKEMTRTHCEQFKEGIHVYDVISLIVFVYPRNPAECMYEILSTLFSAERKRFFFLYSSNGRKFNYIILAGCGLLRVIWFLWDDLIDLLADVQLSDLVFFFFLLRIEKTYISTHCQQL